MVEWPVSCEAQPAQQRLERGVKEDGDSMFRDQAPVLFAEERAAAKRDDGFGQLDRVCKMPGFQLAKSPLPIARKNLSDGSPFFSLDPFVEVDKGFAKPLGEQSPDGRLACRHKTHQKNPEKNRSAHEPGWYHSKFIVADAHKGG